MLSCSFDKNIILYNYNTSEIVDRKYCDKNGIYLKMLYY